MDHRPSSPVASPLTAPPTHFGAFSPFWATMSDDIKKNLAAVPFAALEKALQDAKSAAAKKATQLAEAEFRQIQAKLKTEKAVVTTAICTAEDELADLKRRTRECEHRLGSLEVRERSKSDALLASSKRHNAYTADDRTPDSDTDTPAAAAHTNRASDNPLTAAAVKGQSSVL